MRRTAPRDRLCDSSLNYGGVADVYCAGDVHVAYGYSSQGVEGESEIKPLYLKTKRPLDLRSAAAFREWVGEFAGGTATRPGAQVISR